MTNIDVIKNLRERARKRQKQIVLPEKDDPRIQAAYKIIKEENISE